MTDTPPLQSPYQRLGAEGGISAAIDKFYELVLEDPSLAPFFTDVDMPAQKRHMVFFLSAATGGPDKYEGRDMAAAHAGHNITDAHFERVVEHLVATLQGLGVPDDLIGDVGGALIPLRGQVVSAS
ncbi:MAG TPA: group 1 truncated hemoglobin [Jiangellaceae bacterium]|nr:group 1 truncated hemoglobin [Jiangellaceae bacterium]